MLLVAAASFPSATATTSAAPAAVWRLSAAPTTVVDALGRPWTPARRVVGGRRATTAATVRGTASPQLYRTTRSGIRRLDVPVGRRGTYAVTLYLAETKGRAPGQRRFDVQAEGRHVARRVDPARIAGAGTAGHVLFTTPVRDGTLSLRFIARRGATVFSAAEVVRLRRSTRPRRLRWHDEFSGPAGARPNARRWAYDLGVGADPGWGNGELQTFTDRPQNASLDGHGHLAITARAERIAAIDGQWRNFSSARLKTQERFAWTYGRATARIRMPSGQGIWPGFWLVGENVYSVGWPASGEIDVVEVLGHEPSVAYGSVHGPRLDGSKYGATRAIRTRTPLDAGFHTYGLLWLPGGVQITLDGRPYATYTAADLGPFKRWVYDHPFHLLLNVSVGGHWPGKPDGTTPWPATMLVDHVRVWQ